MIVVCVGCVIFVEMMLYLVEDAFRVCIAVFSENNVSSMLFVGI